MLPNIKAKLLQEVAKERDKYITKSEPKDLKSDELVQATAATVGFVSEIIHYRKEKAIRKQRETNDAPLPASDEALVTSQILDKGAPEPVPTTKGLAAAFLYRHPLPSTTPPQASTTLTTPVLIPQRRPNTRARGFTPAYAPILSSFAIPQTTFLDFIITLNASLEPNPYLNAINLAGYAGEASPEPIVSLMVGIGVEVVTDAIMEAQSRAKSNRFLDEVNHGFFTPRGLFAFVGTWRPNYENDERVVDATVNDSNSVMRSDIDFIGKAKSVATGNTVTKKAWADLRQQMQRAIIPAGGEVATITSAPLVWASVEEIAAATPSDMLKKKDRFDRAGLWLDNHVDKHTQVSWTQEYPDHPLAESLPKPEFRSRYADPSHAASSGDVVALLTGGEWHMKDDEKKREKEMQKEREKARKKEKKLEAKEKKAKSKQENLEAKNQNSGEDNPKAESSRVPNEASSCEQGKRESDKRQRDSSRQRQEKQKSNSGVSSLLKDSLLYLVIVQHPSLTGSK